MPCFEWAPGIDIEDIVEEGDVPLLTIANEERQIEITEQPMLEMEDEPENGEINVLNEDPVGMQDGDELVEGGINENLVGEQDGNDLIDNDIPVHNNDEGLIVIP